MNEAGLIAKIIDWAWIPLAAVITLLQVGRRKALQDIDDMKEEVKSIRSELEIVKQRHDLQYKHLHEDLQEIKLTLNRLFTIIDKRRDD